MNTELNVEQQNIILINGGITVVGVVLNRLQKKVCVHYGWTKFAKRCDRALIICLPMMVINTAVAVDLAK